MPFKLKPPGGERAQYAIVGLAVGLYVAITGFLGEDFVEGSFGVALATVGVGLWFNQQWARWSAIALTLVAVGFIGFRMSQRGFSFLGTAGMIMGLVGAWFIWREFSPEKIAETAEAAEAGDKPKSMISLVLLLREPRYLEARILAPIVSSAWGQEFSGDDTEEDSTRFVVGESPMFAVQSPEGFFVIHNFPSQYFEDTAKAADDLQELRMQVAVRNHQAWMAVDLIQPHDPSATPESFYPQIARLVAELADENVLALYHPDSGKLTVWNEALTEKLRGPDVFEVFGEMHHPPVIDVDGDDPRMQAAVAEAKARWPEFVESFKRREGTNYSVKVPITVGECTEFIWVEVSGLEPEYIHGTLGNEPVELGDLKLGDRVEVPLSDLNDWAFLRDGEPVGLFTAKVMEEIQKARGK
ncbi:MAG TPA: DUF2314 domain-containing protein [Verrucomicrobiae bacterium]|nr:DUF2314 domain-containing protein [Verrucomicrobiae bacterium]